jgi:hypothetical protein
VLPRTIRLRRTSAGQQRPKTSIPYCFPGEGCHAAPDTAEEKDMDPLLIKIPDAAAQLGVSRASSTS